MTAEQRPLRLAELLERSSEPGFGPLRKALGDFGLVTAPGIEEVERSGSWSFSTGASQLDAVSARPSIDLASAFVFPVVKRRSSFFPNLILLGRSATNDIVIEHETISKLHARIRLKDNGFWLEDAGSQNGTFVDDDRVTDRVAVYPDDHVRFGDCYFRVLRWDSVLRGPSRAG